ncbi:MAG TPA: hypothetical protein VK675_00390 [Candidatus Paceibacterota bacterium]|nr:hypothetical protein [Candidatus Paceibacterota bacterium]
MEKNKITDEQRINLCLYGQGAKTCSFLGLASLGFICTKNSPYEAEIILRREEKSMLAMGNNCAGPPTFAPVTKVTASEEK